MTSSPAERRPWSRQRWCGLIALVFLLHVGLVFWLGDRGAARPRQAALAPPVRLAADRVTELMLLNDPTLFALANRHGFSGAMWLQLPQPEYRAAEWTAPPRWLALQVERLGNVFRQFVQTNAPKPFALTEKLEPKLTPGVAVTVSPVPQQSRLRIEGDLVVRPLRAAIEPPSWPHPDILTPTVVQVAVDPRGSTVSATMLSSSGSKEADLRALDLAKTARFEAGESNDPGGGPDPATRLTWGKLVFEWHTTGLTTTNTPPPAP